MLRRLSITASVVLGMLSVPALAAGSAADGLKAMKETNLIVLTDLQAAHDVEGTVFVGRDLTGTGLFGMGNSNQGQATSSAPTLFVGRNSTTGFNDIHIKNGSNGGVGTISTGTSAFIGNDAQIMELQEGPRRLWVGGDLASGGNFAFDDFRLGGNLGSGSNVNGVSGGLIKIEGSTAGSNVNPNGATLTYPDVGLKSQLQTDAASKVLKVTEDVQALSSYLAGLAAGNAALADFNAGNHMLTLNASSGLAGYAVFNLDGAILSSATYTELVYNFASLSLPVIVNVSGLAIDFHLNPTGTSSANNQQVIWNFFEAQSVAFTKMMHGSVLAPYAALTNTTPIEGSVVAKSFIQGGEVHLGTYNLNLPTPPLPPVPEPATWAMMLAGIALVGGLMRRATAARLGSAVAV